MLLAHYLISSAKALNIKVKVAHIEHGIRGSESVADADFVREYCEKNNIEFYFLSLNAPEEAKKAGMTVEEYSRNRRYDFFYSIDCDKIATAHNLSDNVETVIFRLARGTGLKGLCGIPPARDKIIRPLIELSSVQIRNFCDENGIFYRTDSTNLCSDYSRNKIRNDILPLFKSINSDYEDKIAALINDINEDSFFIDKYADYFYEACFDGERLLKEKLNKLDTAIVKRVIIKYFSVNNTPLDRFHLNEVLKLLKKNGKTQIKGDIFAVSDSFCVRLACYGRQATDFRFVSQILNINEFNRNNVDFYCDCDKIVGSVKVRKRMQGDFIKPSGRGCTKSLKKLFNELKIPAESRESVAVIEDDAGLIGLAGICADERVQLTSDTKKVFTISFIPED